MKIKDQTRKLAAGCSKHCFEVADRTDEVRYLYFGSHQQPVFGYPSSIEFVKRDDPSFLMP
uniref:hypothetical protein n=1 Tax=Shigella flexneri TaxID=623 RepID=UPI001C0A7CD0